jgi:hypothetical protein
MMMRAARLTERPDTVRRRAVASQIKWGPLDDLDLEAQRRQMEVPKNQKKSARGGWDPRTLGTPGLCPPTLLGHDATVAEPRKSTI